MIDFDALGSAFGILTASWEPWIVVVPGMLLGLVFGALPGLSIAVAMALALAFIARRTIDLGSIEPLVALPDTVVRNSVPVGKAAGEPIQQAFVGSCANGTLDDLAEAALVVAGRKVSSSVRFIVTPGSQAIYRAAMKAGYVQTLTDAGAVVTAATCGACFGGHMGVLGPGETCITASTRNFKGRMGHPSSRIYMGSAATVAASAIAGHIVHPADVMGKAI